MSYKRSSSAPTRGVAMAQQKTRSSSAAVAHKKATQTFLLPWPPSVNGMWRAVAGRNILSQRYRLWREAAGRALRDQRPKEMFGPVRVAIELSPPDARAFDLDNRVKPLLDLLVANRVISSDDHLTVREISVSTGDGFAASHGASARVTLMPAEKR